MSEHPTRDRLEEYAHDVIEDRAPVERHLGGCAACAAAVDAFRREEAALAELLSAGGARSGAGRRWLPWTAAAAALLIAFAAFFGGDSARVSLVQVRGEVRHLRAEGALPARSGDSILPDQGLLASGPGSFALVRFPDSTTAELREGGTLDRISDGHLTLARGWLRVHAAGALAVRTPGAEVAARGTSFSVAVLAGRTRVEVEAGTLRVTRLEDERSVCVGEGGYAEVSAEAALAPRENVIVAPVRGRPAEYDLLLVPAPRPVEPPAGRAYPPDDPDRRKAASALFDEGLRFETQEPFDFFKAIVKYKKAHATALNEGNREIAVAALVRLGFCREALGNVEEAQEAYRKAAGDHPAVARWTEIARDKLTLRGVDVTLARLGAATKAWRDTAARSPLALEEARAAAWDRIRPLDRAAVPGLVRGLDHPDEVVRDFAADRLAEVADASAVAALASRLSHPGAAAGLEKVLRKHASAAEFDRMADALEEDRTLPKVSERIEEWRRRAKDARGALPANLATPEVERALAAAISDDAAGPAAPRSAARAAGSIGRISGTLVEALVAGFSGPRDVREACCRAAGAADPEAVEDRRRLAEALRRVVRLEPERVGADWDNDATARHAAAEALGRIGLVGCAPDLIGALEDNDGRVRIAAHAALRELTGKDFGYEPDRPREERRAAQARWRRWWEGRGGVEVLVDRFRSFAASWNKASPEKLFEPEAYLSDARGSDRARRAIAEFRRRKDFYVRDAVDLGASASDRWVSYLGDPTPAVRRFAAETCARLGADRLRDALTRGETPAIRAAAAFGLGAAPVGPDGREALRRALSDASADVREAAAAAWGRVGDPSGAADLARAASDPEARVQRAALRAMAVLGLHDKGVEEIALRAADPRVRELAVELLGASGDATVPAALIRARLDPSQDVRQAASEAIRNRAAREPLLAVLRDERQKADLRAGAALGLGDLGDPDAGRALAECLKDPDPGVRSSICRAIGALKPRTRPVLEALFRTLSANEEREAVRDAAFDALKSAAGVEAAPFRASDPRPERDEAIRRWEAWFRQNGGSFPD